MGERNSTLVFVDPTGVLQGCGQVHPPNGMQTVTALIPGGTHEMQDDLNSIKNKLLCTENWSIGVS